MFTAPPAIVRPANDFAPDYQPTAADFAEQSLAEACQHPSVATLIAVARDVMRCDGQHGGAIVALASILSQFPASDRPAPASVPSLEAPPF